MTCCIFNQPRHRVDGTQNDHDLQGNRANNPKTLLMQKHLTLINKDGQKEVATLIVEQSPGPTIELQSNMFNSGKITCEKLYEGFQDLHKRLDAQGLKLLCMGYRYDVRPSGMALSMGHGTRAY